MSRTKQNQLINNTAGTAGGFVELLKMIAKENFPDRLKEKYWAQSAPIVPFGNLQPHTIAKLRSKMDAMEMIKFSRMSRDELASHDPTEHLMVEYINEVILSIGGGGDLIQKAGDAMAAQAMQADAEQRRKPGFGELMFGQEGTESISPDNISRRWGGGGGQF